MILSIFEFEIKGGGSSNLPTLRDGLYHPKGRKAQMTAKTMVGSRLATLIFLPHTRLRPTQKMRMLPVRDRLDRACGVMMGSIKVASKVMAP